MNAIEIKKTLWCNLQKYIIYKMEEHTTLAYIFRVCDQVVYSSVILYIKYGRIHHFSMVGKCGNNI